jgi:4-hydroxy-3-methylbut-2-enyl diphosphate reductase
MIVTIEPHSRPCPGVERAIGKAEDVLGRHRILYSIGELIHNRREIERLKEIGLCIIPQERLFDSQCNKDFTDGYFLVRTHGEKVAVLQQARKCGLTILDTTCLIVRHSQEIVEQHTRDGWGIVIAGDPDHPEVVGLLERSKGNGIVVSDQKEALDKDLEVRSVLLAQTTIHPQRFTEIRRALLSRMPGLKITDTTCRFIGNRQKNVALFSQNHDTIIVIGGYNSSNCRLLYETALDQNKRSYHVEGPDDVDRKWFRSSDRIGLVGGASTPRWQLEEMKSYLERFNKEKNPIGLKNRKGGKFLWWTRKNLKTVER